LREKVERIVELIQDSEVRKEPPKDG
jgi:hypothetical protein